MIKTKVIVTVVTLSCIGALLYLLTLLGRYVFGSIMHFQWFSFWAVPVAGFILFVYMTYRFFLNAIKYIEADPPHKGVLVFLGKRREVLLSEGMHFFPLYPIVFDVVTVNVTKQNINLPEQEIMTPDQAFLDATVSITLAPGGNTGNKKDDAKLLIAYLNSGREKGVQDIQIDVIKDRLRSWASSGDEGPATWQEARGSKEDANAVLIKAVLGEDIPSIPGDIPTSVLLRYFHSPKKSPLELQKLKWGKRTGGGDEWEGLEDELNRMNAHERTTLEEAVKERQHIIAKAMAGNGFFVNRSLGVTVSRFTVNNIVLSGRTKDAADKRTQEVEERKAEIIELEHVSQRIGALKKENRGMTTAQAIEVVQTERGKVVKHVHEGKISASDGLTGLLKSLSVAFKRKP